MKTKTFKYDQLFKLYLLKSRVYESPIKKTNSNGLINVNLDQTLVGIKKALQIIFQYNQINKCILFVGLPSKLESQINILTRHVAVPRNADVSGFISNNNVKLLKDIKNLTQTLSKKYSKSLLPKLTKKPDLVILFNHEKEKTIRSEAWIAKIPIIVFQNKNGVENMSADNSYVINGNFQSALITFDTNIFFICLNFLFKDFKRKQILPSSVSPKMRSPSFTKRHQEKQLKRKDG